MLMSKTASAILLVIGGLNWGLVGLFQFNLVAAIFGDGTIPSRIIYSLVGLSALYYALTSLPEDLKRLSEPTRVGAKTL